MNNLLVGYGEIGKGLYEALNDRDLSIQDPDKGYDFANNCCDSNVDILHICIPGNVPEFKNLVAQYRMTYKPALTIIHSTVPIGTTRQLGGHIVHSPIRGKHPNMVLGIKTYLKHIGYLSKEDGLIAAEYFENHGVKAEIFDRPETTEIGKLLELFRYGMNILIATEQKRICDDAGVDYRTTVSEFIDSYNEGLDKLGLCWLKQTDCEPMGGDRLGGHCVIENCFELHEQLPGLTSVGGALNLKDLLAALIYFGQGDRRLL